MCTFIEKRLGVKWYWPILRLKDCWSDLYGSFQIPLSSYNKFQNTLIWIVRLNTLIIFFQFSQGDINEHCRSRSGSNSQRRGSNYEGSASKVDMLRSAIEISHHHGRGHISNNSLSSNRTSNHYKVSLQMIKTKVLGMIVSKDNVRNSDTYWKKTLTHLFHY